MHLLIAQKDTQRDTLTSPTKNRGLFNVGEKVKSGDTQADIYSMYGHIIYGKSKDQPCKVVNPACGQLNRENEYFPVPVRD